MTEPTRPLVTFALFAYNQSEYVREAIAGAFAQDYSPLEIIMSDDCSSDDTFEIMLSAAQEYRGPHKIKLNRNFRNLNIGGHVNVLNRLAEGELVVVAAGDDISMPERVSRIVETWLAGNKHAGVLHSNCRMLTQSGDLQDFPLRSLAALDSLEVAARTNPAVVGPTVAWDRALFNFFGDLRGDVIHEDCALPFRALLAGRSVAFIAQPLLLYRIGVGVMSAFYGRQRRLTASLRKRLLTLLLSDALQKLADLNKKPNLRVTQIVTGVANRYEVSILLENGIPTLPQWRACVAKAGLPHVMRMTAKRIVNFWRDRWGSHVPQ